ncbi:hypothetical protein C2E23DRAFT_856015 [Lenzites betulinus]|nr:hypothetical protein C2E23DRAFT_856015 [Lenzites betulinus]
MVSSDEYRRLMFNWLESVIKSVVEEQRGHPLPRPKRSEDSRNPHPGDIAAPSIEGFADEREFEAAFESFVTELVKEFNWHEHNKTCFKYAEKGLVPKDAEQRDALCRMRMDGTTRPETVLDDETGGILLRRLHPRIANYNDLVIFLIKSNMEIKFIGSGEAAKALLYYITDYVTKENLPAHVGLAALSYAIQKTNELFPLMDQEPGTYRPKSALNITVNRMMSHQEISHQQIMSYLVGGGDVYTSHRFRVLHWGAFDRLFRQTFDGNIEVEDIEHSRAEHAENDEDVESHPRLDLTGLDVDDDVEEPSVEVENGETFMLKLQPGSISAMSQQQDYVYRSTEQPFDDRSDEERDSDVRRVDETWSEAFDRQRHRISAAHERVMANMNVLSECRDVRDGVRALRRAEALAMMRDGGVSGDSATHTGLGDQNIDDEYQLFDDPNTADMFEGLENLQSTEGALDGKIGSRAREALDSCYTDHEGNMRTGVEGPPHDIIGSRIRSEDDEHALSTHAMLMKQLKELRRPQFGTRQNGCEESASKRLRTTEVLESVSTAVVRGNAHLSSSVDIELNDSVPDLITYVVKEMGLDDNPEQERAFRIVAEHVESGDEQLLMYVAGVGGTGKTHVIKAILKYFELLGRSREILVGAPTGAKFLSDISARLQQGKANDGPRATLPFGGVNIVFTGDFGQLKPVRASTLLGTSQGKAA